MRTIVIAFAWIVCLGVCADADDARRVDAAPAILTVATDASLRADQKPPTSPPTASPQTVLPPTVLPQVSLPGTPLPQSNVLPAVRAPDPRSAGIAHRFELPRGRTCFTQAETRENIAFHRLSEPVKAMHMGRQQGEPLRARLCRWKPDEFVYEVSVLRHDGRVVHIYMNARNGQTVGALNDNDRR